MCKPKLYEVVMNAIVTGASRGIGRACAIRLASRGDNVIVCYRENEAAAEETVSECLRFGVKALKSCVDVTDENAVRRTVALTECELGGVDILVNNAGVCGAGVFTEFTDADYHRIFDTDVLGQMYFARAASRVMIARGQGSIVNISSMWGICGASCEVLYSSAKAAIIGFTRSLAQELAPSGITVNCVAPGVIDTDMNRCYDSETMSDLVSRTPLGRLGQPEDVAGAVAFLTSADASFITGAVLNVSGGFVI